MALSIAASSNREYGDAVAFAAEYARLLTAAQRQGLQITPEIEAQIRSLAEAYVAAAENTRLLADGMDDIQARTERGVSAISDLFMAATQGSDQARQALARLALQVAEVMMMRGLMGLSGGKGGGLFALLGSLLGRAGGGGVKAGHAYRVNENTPNSEVFVPSRSGGVLNVAQAKEALSGQGGGAMTINVNVDGARGDQHIVQLVRAGVSAGLTEYDRNMPARFQKINTDPRRMR